MIPAHLPALWLAAALAVPLLALAWTAPPLLPMALGFLLGVGGLALTYRHLTAVWCVWLIATGLSLEMTLSDIIGPEAFQPVIAAAKGGEIALVLLTVAREGFVWDRFNPAFAFLAIAAMGAMAGVHPELTAADTIRSTIGSTVPFLIFFVRPTHAWGAALRRATGYIPLVSVALGALLDLAGLRPLFVDSGGVRLAALGHPAFLAGICLPAIYTCLLAWLNTGTRSTLLLLAANLAILVLTGARAPTAYALLTVTGTLLLARDTAIARGRRLLLAAIGALLLPVLLLMGESLGALRLFSLLGADAAHLSGRELLWAAVDAAANEAPWFGWGLGAGNVVIPRDGPIAQLLHTWAAHNEYLRMRLEGGAIGLSLLILLFLAWIMSHTRRLPPLERLTMRLVFLAFAAHAVTDNVLISTPACVFFAFAAAVFGDTPRRLRADTDVA